MQKASKTITISLNKALYSKRAIEETIRTYKETKVGKFTLSGTKKQWLILVSDFDWKFRDEMKKEFCNYVLSQLPGSIK